MYYYAEHNGLNIHKWYPSHFPIVQKRGKLQYTNSRLNLYLFGISEVKMTLAKITLRNGYVFRDVGGTPSSKPNLSTTSSPLFVLFCFISLLTWVTHSVIYTSKSLFFHEAQGSYQKYTKYNKCLFEESNCQLTF